MADAERTILEWEIPQQVQEADYILTYCTAGWRGSVAQNGLEERLKRPVYNLGGGLTAWYNAGESVWDTVNGKTESINKIHPCAPLYVQWCYRENEYELPA